MGTDNELFPKRGHDALDLNRNERQKFVLLAHVAHLYRQGASNGSNTFRPPRAALQETWGAKKTIGVDAELCAQLYEAFWKFLNADVDIGIAFSELALQSGKDLEKRRRNRQKARKAYLTVVRFGQRFRFPEADAQEFEQKLRRLKAVLQQLSDWGEVA